MECEDTLDLLADVCGIDPRGESHPNAGRRGGIAVEVGALDAREAQ
jgi:hypothetical protein